MRNAMTGDAMMEYFDLMVKASEAGFVKQKTEIDLIEQKNGYLLEQISYEETLVNKVYDKQIERLDAIYRIQEDINQSQRERFDIVQQIAAGDMAGAARAIQDARQREALAQIEKKRQAVEDQRKKALGGITAGGKTREQIEKENLDNAQKMNTINLQAFDQLVKIRDFITQVTNKTPEQLTAYSELAKAAQALGLDLNLLDVEGAINASVQGKAEAFLTMLEGKATKLFDKILGTDKSGFLGKTNEKYVELPNGSVAPAAFWGGDPKASQGQGNYVLDPNTDATENNTSKNTKAIEGWLPAGSGSGSGSGKKKTNAIPTTSTNTKNTAISQSPTAVDQGMGVGQTYGNVTNWVDQTIANAEKNKPNYAGPGGSQRAKTDNENRAKSNAVTVKTDADFKTITIGTGNKARAVTVPKSFGFSKGGLVPKYFARGGFAKGTDKVPAVLTPGEFVIRDKIVDKIGVPFFNKINGGNLDNTTFNRMVEPYPGMNNSGNSVYNYSVSVNVSNTNANPNDIARAVISQIKQIDSQRIRSSR